MKVYIAMDSEGSACVVGEAGPGGTHRPWQLEYIRRRMTEETAAAVEGARDGGATDIVVHDIGFLRGCVPAGLVLHYDDLPRGIRIAMGDAPIKQVCDDSFDAAFLLGHHARAGVKTGVMAHTFSSVSIENIYLNDQEVGEIPIEALQIGARGVPVVFVSADADGVREAKQWLGDIEVVSTKQGLGCNCAISLHPADACDLIRKHAALALKRLADFRPFHINPPYELKIVTTSQEAAETRVKRHNAERVGPRTVLLRTDDPLALW